MEPALEHAPAGRAGLRLGAVALGRRLACQRGEREVTSRLVGRSQDEPDVSGYCAARGADGRRGSGRGGPDALAGDELDSGGRGGPAVEVQDPERCTSITRRTE